MDQITKGQDRELNRIAQLFYNERSKTKGYFPDDKSFTKRDKFEILKNFKMAITTISSVLRAPTVIKRHNNKKEYLDAISMQDFEKLDNYIRNEMEMDTWGVAQLTSQDVFKGKGIPFEHAIVMSKNMDKEKFITKDLPNMDCQLEVMKIYGDTGVAALKVTKFLRQFGYAAAPNHSLGGNIDYAKAGMDANIGFIGKHGMLITPENGSCNRISVVYTNIENLSNYLTNDRDHSWGYEFCKKCNKCIKMCPYDAIYAENKSDEYGNVECISNDKCNSGFKEYGCGICIATCPFTHVGYEKIFDRFVKKQNQKPQRKTSPCDLM